MLKDNLKILRKNKGLSQEELSIKLHVVRQTVSKWESGLSVPDAEMLMTISEILETPVSEILGESIEEKEKNELIQASIAGLLTSFGVPFLHMGEEIGQSKNGQGNTYNSGDKLNQFDYDRLDGNFAMAEGVSKWIALRKALPFLSSFSPKEIDENFDLTDYRGCLRLVLKKKDWIKEYGFLVFYINPSNHEVNFVEEGDMHLVLSTSSQLGFDSEGLLIPPRTVSIYSNQ